MRRASLLVLLVAALAAAALAPGAGARPAADPVASAAGFARTFLTGDPAACTRMSAALTARLARLELDCDLFVELIADSLEQPLVEDAFADVEDAVVELSITEWNGRFMPKRGAVETLVRALRASDSGLRVRSGRGPGAARTARAGVVVVDLASTPTRLLLHTRAGSGRVWTSVVLDGKDGRLRPSSVRGALLVDPIGPGSRTIAAGASHTTVLVPLRDRHDGSVLVGLDAAGAVDVMLFGGSVADTTAAAETVDPAVVGPDLVQAWKSSTMAGLCRLAAGDLATDMGSGCTSTNPFRNGAVDIGTHALDPPVAGAATLVDVTLHVDGQALGISHLLTHDAAGTHVHAIFLDMLQLAEAGAAAAKLPI